MTICQTCHGIALSGLICDACFARLIARVDALETACADWRALAERGYQLSKYAAAIRWDRRRNTVAWMNGLREKIEAVQAAWGAAEEKHG
jgi:hypothetical protein